MRTRMLSSLILVLVQGLLFSSAATAGFSTYSKDWPNDAEIVGEGKNTTTTDQLGVKEDCVASNKSADLVDDTIVPRTANKRLYLKFGSNFNSAQIKAIKNYSYNALSTAELNVNTVRKNYISWEIGAGSKINALRYEVEYIHTKDISYNVQTLFVGRAERFSSTVTNRSILLNIFFDFENFSNLNFNYFRPYIGVLGGATWNKTRSIMQGGIGDNVPKNGNKIGFTWGVTFGARVPFGERWTGYFGYRFTRQPKVLWKNDTSVLLLKGKYILSGFNLGASFLI